MPRKLTAAMVDAMHLAGTHPHGEFPDSRVIPTAVKVGLASRGLGEWRTLGDVYGRTCADASARRLFLTDAGRAWLAER